jgi:hypothetical protein
MAQPPSPLPGYPGRGSLSHGAVGKLEDVSRHARMGFEGDGIVYLIGPAVASLGSSEFLERIHDRTAGTPPPIDLDLEARVQRVVRTVISKGIVRVAHDATVGAGRGDELHGHRADAARRTPHQHVMAGPQDVRTMAEQHAVGGGERQRVAGALFPGEMLRALHQLARLHLAELGERAVRRLVAPDALAGGEHRIPAVALLVVAVVLVTVDDDLVADLPALHLGADRPDDA